MFDTAWQGQFETDGRRAMGLSWAAALHVAVLAAVAAASLLVTKQFVPPQGPTVLTIVAPLPEPDPAGPPSLPAAAASAPAATPKLTPEPIPEAPVPEALSDPAPAVQQPELVPDLIADVTPDPTTGGGRLGNGDPIGTGSGADPSGTSPLPGERGGPPGPGGGSAEPQEVRGFIVPPTLERKVKPDYPETARVARMEGRVILRAVIGETGEVRDVEIVHSSNRMFESAAVEAVRQWRYQPATLRGAPLAVYLNVTVEFGLH